MSLGPRDLSSLVQLTGWDATALSNFRLQDGTTYAQIVSEMSTALGALNTELSSDAIWAGLISISDQPDTEYRMGASNGFEDHTEYGRTDEKRAATEGHMIPLRGRDRRLGWTWDYLKKARMSQVTADIQDAIKDARDLWRVKILARLLKRGDESGAINGLGAAGLSPGFATTAASTGVDFVPPTVGGTVFTSTHEHYVGITGGAFTLPVFQDAKDELREHGHDLPFDFIISPFDEAAVRALAGFVPAPSLAGVQYGTSTSIAQLNQSNDTNGNYYIGVLEDFRIRVVRGMPQYYGVGYKTYGNLSQRNALRVRLEPGQTSLQVVAITDPTAGNGFFPLQSLMLYTEFGVGVNDRTAATARYVNSATWADGIPT